jgi:putative Mg2+ transporter-C (MgtC) family protein
VIVRSNTQEMRVRGFTTAACIWLTACIGVVCAIGAWVPILVTLALIFLLLVFGGPAEKFLHRRLNPAGDE